MPVITAQNRKWWVVIAMSGVMILLTVDFFGITVALPRIGDDLDASTTTLLWTVNAYLLAFVSPMIAIGRFADIFGRRRMALIGIVLFVTASAACAGAPTVLFLIAARVVQGVGGGIIFTVSVSIVNNAFEPEERAKALGIWSGVGLAGSALGPFLAGILTEFASWRWFFFLNVPIGIVTFFITVAAVEESRDTTFTGGIDWTGFATLTVGFVLTIVGFQQASNEGWGTVVVLGPIAIGVAFLAVFVVNELRLKRRVPLVQFSLFRDLRFAGASVVAFIGNWMFGVILFFLTLYLQNVLDLNPLAAGGVFLFFSVPLVVMSPVGGRLVSRFGSQELMAVGMALVAVGMFFFTLIDADSGIGFVLIGLVIAGFGQGFAYNISNTAGMESMPDEKAGIASGVLQTARLMGIVIGLALSSSLFTSLENRELLTQAHASGASAADIDDVRGLLSGSTSAEQHVRTLTGASRALVEQITDIAFTHALRYVMLVGVLLCLVCIWPALWGRRKPAPAGEHPKTAHPLWASLWRRHQRRVPAGSTPASVNLAVHDWGGEGHPVLLAHPTGFHGLTWSPVAARLVARGRRVWSFDYRGHGDSDRSPDGYQWSKFADDVMAVVRDLGLAGESTLLACGHSKGAASLLLGEAREPGAFPRLWCYEPIVFPSDDPLQPQDDFPLAAGARRRRAVWSSRDEAFASYGSKPPLDVLDPDALRAYVDYGLRDRPDGQVELKCRPEDEAATYAMGTANGVYPRLREVRCPTVVVCGEHTDAISPALGEMIVERLPAGRLEVMPGVGHFGPMQDPDATVESMLRFAAAT